MDYLLKTTIKTVKQISDTENVISVTPHLKGKLLLKQNLLFQELLSEGLNGQIYLQKNYYGNLLIIKP